MSQAERDELAVGCRFYYCKDFHAVVCNHVGVAPITHVVVKRNSLSDFEARVGVAIMGSTQNPEGCSRDANPFDPRFEENWCGGKGKTEEEALKGMVSDIRGTSVSLFAC